MVSILEELGGEVSGDVEDAFDAEGFCEMMAAYFPEFSTISLPEVCLWMFELEATLRQSKQNGELWQLYVTNGCDVFSSSLYVITLFYILTRLL